MASTEVSADHAPAAGQAAAAVTRSHPMRWVIASVLFLAVISAFFDRISIAVLFTNVAFQNDMGIGYNPTLLGLLMTSFVFAYGASGTSAQLCWRHLWPATKSRGRRGFVGRRHDVDGIGGRLRLDAGLPRPAGRGGGAPIRPHKHPREAMVSGPGAGARQFDLDDRQPAWLGDRISADDIPGVVLWLARVVLLPGRAQPGGHSATGSACCARSAAARFGDRGGCRAVRRHIRPAGAPVHFRLAFLDAGDLQFRGAHLSVGPQQLAAELSGEGPPVRFEAGWNSIRRCRSS